ncbi:MAG: HypC/HybG/HupF family hydrogenase formation chaperone [Calditrichaceae bacterium]|jgi:hydrogenase expression/formation protein HypC
MCLAIPGKIVEIYEENELRMGKIDFSGTMNTACLEYVPDVEVGHYVVVHAGFAIQVLDEAQAQEVFEAWDDLTDTLKEEGYTVEGEPLSKKKKDLN